MASFQITLRAIKNIIKAHNDVRLSGCSATWTELAWVDGTETVHHTRTFVLVYEDEIAKHGDPVQAFVDACNASDRDFIPRKAGKFAQNVYSTFTGVYPEAWADDGDTLIVVHEAFVGGGSEFHALDTARVVEGMERLRRDPESVDLDRWNVLYDAERWPTPFCWTT